MAYISPTLQTTNTASQYQLQLCPTFCPSLHPTKSQLQKHHEPASSLKPTIWSRRTTPQQSLNPIIGRHTAHRPTARPSIQPYPLLDTALTHNEKTSRSENSIYACAIPPSVSALLPPSLRWFVHLGRVGVRVVNGLWFGSGCGC